MTQIDAGTAALFLLSGAMSGWILAHVFLFLRYRDAINKGVKMSDTKPKLDLTKPIMTRDGCSAELLRILKGDHEFPVIVVLKRLDGSEILWSYTLDGKIGKSGPEALGDLINVPEKRVVWVYEFEEGSLPDWHNNIVVENNRSSTADKDCISRIKIEFESGRKDE